MSTLVNSENSRNSGGYYLLDVPGGAQCESLAENNKIHDNCNVYDCRSDDDNESMCTIV